MQKVASAASHNSALFCGLHLKHTRPRVSRWSVHFQWSTVTLPTSRSSGSATDQARIDSQIGGHCVTVTAICLRLCLGQTVLALLIQRGSPWTANNAASPVLPATVFFVEGVVERKLSCWVRETPNKFKAEVRCPCQRCAIPSPSPSTCQVLTPLLAHCTYTEYQVDEAAPHDPKGLTPSWLNNWRLHNKRILRCQSFSYSIHTAIHIPESYHSIQMKSKSKGVRHSLLLNLNILSLGENTWHFITKIHPDSLPAPYLRSQLEPWMIQKVQ